MWVENRQKLDVLRRRCDFLKLREEGHKSFLSSWMFINIKENEIGKLRCGWTIPKKVGNAVLRNKMKRWCRAYLRQRLTEEKTPRVDINFVMRARDKEFYRNLNYNEFAICMDKAWRLATKSS